MVILRSRDGAVATSDGKNLLWNEGSNSIRKLKFNEYAMQGNPVNPTTIIGMAGGIFTEKDRFLGNLADRHELLPPPPLPAAAMGKSLDLLAG